MDKPAWSDEATVEDIYYCYRLLLKREPSQADLDYWCERVRAEQLNYSRLAEYFRQSREYVIGRKARGFSLLQLDDFELYVQEHDWDIGENLIETKQYEPHVTSFLKEHLQQGMTFVDIGANVGFFTLTAATKVGESGKVIAVECNPRNCELIYMSLHRNGFDQVTVYPFAVGETQKLMSFSWGFSNGFVDELAQDDEEAFIVQKREPGRCYKNGYRRFRGKSVAGNARDDCKTSSSVADGVFPRLTGASLCSERR
jgi:hypothetical protein